LAANNAKNSFLSVRWQFLVDSNGLTGPGTIQIQTTVPGAAYEICTVICQSASVPFNAGTPGNGAPLGQFVSGLGLRNSIAISPLDGDLFAIDSNGSNTLPRLRRFNADGSLDGISQFGAGKFSSGSNNRPTSIAVDSQGILYAADTDANGEIERYDSSGVHLGGTPGFLAPIAAPPLLPGAATSVTSGLAVDLGATPSEDRLFVFRDPATGNSAIQELVDPGQVIPPAAATNHSTTVFGTGTSLGIGYSETLDRLYVASIAGAAGHGYFGLDADGTTAPTFTLEDPTDLSGLGATFNATIDANGSVNYLFEFSKDGLAWTPLGASRTLAGDAPQLVSRAAVLEANTAYRVRLQVSKAFAPANVVTQTSPEVLFQTPELGAEAITLPVYTHSDTSAVLAGRVKPNGKPTTYRFEWGQSTAYGNQVPLTDGDAGLVEKVVAERLEGLAPDTTYHYRLVAENEVGEDFGEDRTFTTRSIFAGFAERAYEQATPVEKIGEVLTHHPSSGSPLLQHARPVTPAGDGLIFTQQEPFAEADFGSAPGANLQSDFIARRLSDRWVLRLSPRAAEIGGNATTVFTALGGPNASKAITVSGQNGWHERPGSPGNYLLDLDTGATSYLWPITSASVSPGSVTHGGITPSGTPLAATSVDMRQMVIPSPHPLTAEPGTPTDPAIGKVYEWIDGELSLASINEAGNPFTDSTAAGINGRNTNVLSEDGRHIFLSSSVAGFDPLPATKVYRRSDAQTTTLASPSKRTIPDPLGEKAKVFQLASTDGDRVFFTSSQLLTDDANTGPGRAGTDLYRYEVSTDTLIDVSAETNTANGARVQGILGASDDGDWIYYVGLGQVIAGKGTAGSPNVYAWHDDGSAEGETRFVATLGSGPGCASGDLVVLDACNYAPSDGRRTARVSADGQTAVFHSSLALLGNQTNGHFQVYAYEADASNGEGELSCVSCRPDGTPSEDFSYLSPGGGNVVGGNQVSQPLSDDGRRVFFNSEDDLLPADTNGLSDVYLWEEGRLQLITSGKSSDDSYFFGATPSGDDVFFYTREALVGQDYGDAYDIYTAKVGGGLLSQNMPPPGEPCQGEACKPASLPQPQGQSSPSSNATGPGNVKAKPSKGCARHKSKRGRRACARRRQAQACAKRKSRQKRKACVKRTRKHHTTRSHG